ncbi:MAG: protein kinase [Ktedonobacterales bacterium]
MHSLIGQQLGAYRLEAELGHGSMGAVYRAMHIAQGKPYAVKILLDSLVSDVSFITRFTREAHVVAKLRHPNIVRVYESGREGERIYFVMEYFPGTTAGQQLKERKRIPYGEVIEIAAQAADALAYAHIEGRLVHRDIKPDNLLVDRWRRVKVLDFGLARIEGLDTITRAGTVVGSLYYVSPEQLLGRKLDGRADVYALGVTMYELLTGQRPYRGQTLTEMSDAILYATTVPLSLIEPSVPRELELIIARAMARDLDQRYATAGDLCLALRELQATISISSLATVAAPAAAGPPSIPPTTQRGEVSGKLGQERQSHQGAYRGPDGFQAPDLAPQSPQHTQHTAGPMPAAPRRTLRASLRPATLEPTPDTAGMPPGSPPPTQR